MGEENVKIIDDDEVNILMNSGGNWQILEFFHVPTTPVKHVDFNGNELHSDNILKEVEKELETKPYVYVKDEELQTIYRLCAYRME